MVQENDLCRVKWEKILICFVLVKNLSSESRIDYTEGSVQEGTGKTIN